MAISHTSLGEVTVLSLCTIVGHRLYVTPWGQGTQLLQELRTVWVIKLIQLDRTTSQEIPPHGKCAYAGSNWIVQRPTAKKGLLDK